MIKKPLIKILISLTFSLYFYSALGQISVSNHQHCDGSPVKLSEKDYEFLKKSTVYFVANNYLIEDREEFSDLLQKNWKYSKIKLIEEAELTKYISKENSVFFSIGYRLLDGRFQDMYYELWRLKDLSKEIKSYNKLVYASITLDLDCSVYYKSKKTHGKKLDEMLNSELKLNNFKPGLFGNYLKIISKCLSNRENICSSVKDKEKLADLSEDTLYITQNFLQQINFTNNECTSSNLEENEIMNDYPYPYKFISMEELDAKLLRNEDFYYLLHLPTGGDFTIYSSKGLCVFTTLFIPNQRAKYMKVLAKLVGT